MKLCWLAVLITCILQFKAVTWAVDLASALAKATCRVTWLSSCQQNREFATTLVSLLYLKGSNNKG